MSAVSAFPLLTSVPLAAFAVGTASAFADDLDSRWRWSVTPYLWATDVGIDARLDGRSIVDQTIPVTDLLEDVDVTLQGRLEASDGERGFLLDVFYVSMSDEAKDVPLPVGSGTAGFDWRMDVTIADLAATWDPRGDGEGLSLVCGVRILDTRTEVDGDITASGHTSSKSFDVHDTLVDVLGGVRFSAELAPRLFLQSQVDVSTGGTDSTWSAFPWLSYAVADGGPTIIAGYRHMEIDFKESGGVDTTLSLSGAVLGLRFSL
jgi:hypothetical protein